MENIIGYIFVGMLSLGVLFLCAAVLIGVITDWRDRRCRATLLG